MKSGDKQQEQKILRDLERMEYLLKKMEKDFDRLKLRSENVTLACFFNDWPPISTSK